LVAVILSLVSPIKTGITQTTAVTMPTQVISSPSANIQRFGRTVEVDGTRAIVEESSNVYIYEFSNNRWDLSADLPLPDGAFTGSVALDGSTAVIQYGINSSVILGVFELRNSEWGQVASFTLPFSANAVNSTNPLAISGNTVVIGVKDFDGVAHVYEKIDNVWAFVTEFTSPPTGSELPPVFARDLDVNDDTIVINQTSINIDGGLTRAVFVYKRNDGAWFQEARLPIFRASLGIDENNLGGTHKAVSLSANRLIVAVRSGALVFDRINGNWTEVGYFGPSNLAVDPNNQSSLNDSITTVSLSSAGNQVAIGSKLGRVFQYQLVNGEWVETELGTNNSPLNFGVSVSIDSEHLMVGSFGALYYYRLNQVAQCIDTDGDGFGWNGTNTCTPTQITPVVNSTESQQCIDTDGDGFGWDGMGTCIPEFNGSVTNSSANGNCDYSDADLFGGWGWDPIARRSCEPLETVLNPQPTTQCIDTDGDGWGWDGTASCIP